MDVFFLGNYTQDLISNKFAQICKNENLQINVHVSGYNQYRQEIINKESSLFRLKPEIIILSLDLFTLVEDIIYAINKLQDKVKLITKR